MSNFNDLNEPGTMELLPMGGSSSVAPQSIPDDFSSVEGIVMGDTWRGITRPEDRIASVDSAYGRFVDQMNKDKSVLVPWQDHDGVAKELPVFNPAGGLTKVGREYFDQSRAFLEQAARREDGGVAPSPFNDQLEVSQDLVGLLGKQQKQFDPLHDMGAYVQERQALGADADAQKSMTFQDFVDFANAEIGSDEAKLDPENKELQKEWATRMQRQLYDPTKMDSGQMMDKVAGQWVLNPNNYSEVDKMEGAIQSNEDLTGSQKKRMLMDYRALVEQHAGELVNAFSAADAGVLGSIVSSPLRDEFMAAMAEPGASAYEFVKANKERFSKDSYGIGSELGAKFRDAVMATGTGALWAASLGNYTEPAEAWGGLAEDTSKAYNNDKVFSVFGVDINRRDLTELTGQVGSFVAMGGMGALAGKGLLKVGSTAGRYAGVAESGKYVLKSTLAAGATAEGAAVKTLGQKTLAGLKAAGTDPEVYIGSLQAAGMSYGKTFNENFERTGNREEATKAANIDAISDGLSAFIATSVMNRVAPGMGKAFGMADEGVSGGIIQNLRARAMDKESMEQIGKVLDDLKNPIGADVRKAFAKDLVETMSLSAKQLGLKGIGVVGNMGAEAVEESADEMISDVIGSMLDDSKTWKEDVWANIGEKWKEYVKAGVLGAIGGGMGDATGVATSPRQVFGKSEAYKAQEGMWDQIRTRVQAFDSLEPFATAEVAGFKNMAEFIQADKPVNADGTASMTDEQWVAKKSQALLASARFGFQEDFAKAVMGKAPIAPETADSTAPASDMGSTATEGPATPPAPTAAPKNGTPVDHPVGSIGHAMTQAGIDAPAGTTWNNKIAAEEGQPVALKSGTVITPLSVTTDRKIPYVAAKVVEMKNGQVVSERIVSPADAATLLNGSNRTQLQKAFQDRANQNNETEHTEWSIPQGTVTPTNTPAAPVADAPKKYGNLSATEGGGTYTPPSQAAVLADPSLKPEQHAQARAKIQVETASQRPTTTPQQKSVLSKLASFFGGNTLEHREDSNESDRYVMNGQSLSGATSVIGKIKGSPEESAKLKQYSEEGKEIHKVLENFAEGKPLDKASSEFEKALHKRFGAAVKAGDVFLSEMVVADPENGLAGKLDLVQITASGEVFYYDLKTTVDGTGKNYSTSPLSAGGEQAFLKDNQFGPSRHQKDSIQSATYLRMLSKTLGVEIPAANGRIIYAERRAAPTWAGVVNTDTSPEVMGAVDQVFESAKQSLSQAKEPSTPLAPTPEAEPKPPTKDNDGQNQTDAKGKGQAERQVPTPVSDPTSSEPSAPEADAASSDPMVAEFRKALVSEGVAPSGKEPVMTTIAGPKGTRSSHVQDNGIFVDTRNPSKVVVTDKAISEELEKANGDEETAWNNLEKRIQDLKAKAIEGSSLKALDPEAKPFKEDDASTLLNQDQTYVADSALIEGGTDSVGGKWRKVKGRDGGEIGKGATPDTYFYSPPAGGVLNLNEGDVVVISGNPNEVLVLEGNDNGSWKFRKISTEIKADSFFTNKKLLNQNNKWTRSRLTAIAAEMGDLFPKIVALGHAPNATDLNTLASEMRNIFGKTLKIVSPSKTFKVVEEVMVAGDFLYAHEDDTIRVDFKQLARKFHGLYKNSTKTDDFSRSLLGLDAARELATMIDEELVHLIGFKIFNPEEINGFYKSLYALKDQKGKDGKSHPLYDMLLETIEERFPGMGLDPSPVKIKKGSVGKQQGALYTVASEMLRKMQQLANSGTTTELATAQSKALQRAILYDHGNTPQKGVNKHLKAIGQMFKRYASRIRNILWMRWQMGMLAPESRDMMARMMRAYQDYGIKGDVEYGSSAALQSAVDSEREYSEKFEKETNELGRESSMALMELRDVVRSFGKLSLDEIVETDRETMHLRISPKIRAYIEKGGLMDLTKVDAALARLNAEGAINETASYQKAMTSAFLKQQVMMMRRDDLGFDPSNLYDELKRDKDGKVSPLGLWLEIMRGVPDAQIISEGAEAFAGVFNPIQEERNKAWSNVERLSHVARALAIKAVSDIDVTTNEGKRALLKWGRLANVVRPGQKVNARLPDYQLERGMERKQLALPNQQGQRSVNESLLGKSPDKIVAALESYKKSVAQRLQMTGFSSDRKAEFDKLASPAVIEVMEELRLAEENLSAVTESLAVLKQMAGLNVAQATGKPVKGAPFGDVIETATPYNLARSIKDKETALSPAAQAEAQDRYKRFVSFNQAVDDYNDSIKFVVNRSLGSFFVSSKDFGLNLHDLSQPTGKGSQTRYTSIKDKLDPVRLDMDAIRKLPTSAARQKAIEAVADAVFGGAVIDSSEFAFSYTTPFIYPKKDKDGAEIPLTEEEIEFNDGLQIYRSRMQSNAEFVGRAHRRDFWIQTQIGNVRSIGLSEKYEATGGFNFEFIQNPDTEQIRYETPQDVFRKFDSSALSEIVYSITQGGGEKSIVELFNFIQQLNAWSAKVRSTYQGGVEKEIGGLQTVADRVVPLLDRVFSRVDSRGDGSQLTQGLDQNLRDYAQRIHGFLDNFIELNQVDFGGFVEDYSEALPLVEEMVNGEKQMVRKVVLKSGHKMADVAKEFSRMVWSDDTKALGLNQSVRDALQTVDLVRKAMEGFQDQRWLDNVEKEGSRVMRDRAYQPDNQEMLQLRENTSDPRVLNLLAWTLEFFEFSKEYVPGENWAFELKQMLDRTNYGEGRMPFVKAKPKTIRVDAVSLDEQESFDLHSPSQDGYVRDGDEFKKVVNAPARDEFSPFVNPDSQVLNPDRDVYNGDDFRTAGSGMGEQGNDANAWTNQFNSWQGSGSTPFESATRAFTRPEVSRGIVITQIALMIGSNATAGRSAREAKQFYFDLMRAEREADWYSMEDVEAEMLKVGKESLPAKPVLDFTGELSNLTAAERQQVEADLLKTYYRKVMNDNLVDRGLRGIFPGFAQVGNKSWGKVIRQAFLDDHNGDYVYSSSEQFLNDLLEFKMKFERIVVENALVRDNAKISRALQSVLNATVDLPEGSVDWTAAKGVAEMDLSTVMQNIAKTLEDETAAELVSTTRKNNFVSDYEAKRIGLMLHKHMLEGGMTIHDARLKIGVGTGNDIVDQLLENMIGETLIVQPTFDQVTKAGLGDIGPRLFPGTDTIPNVIYAPLNQNGPELNANDAHGLVAQMLANISTKSPQAAEAISAMADKIHQATDPVLYAESLYDQLYEGGVFFRSQLGEGLAEEVQTRVREIKELEMTKDEFVAGMVDESSAMRTLAPFFAGLNKKSQEQFRQAVQTHFLNVTGFARKLRFNSQTRAQHSMFPNVDRDFETDILLVAEVLTNRAAKAFFDHAYLGVDQVANSLLGEGSEKQLHIGIRNIRRLGADEEAGDYWEDSHSSSLLDIMGSLVTKLEDSDNLAEDVEEAERMQGKEVQEAVTDLTAIQQRLIDFEGEEQELTAEQEASRLELVNFRELDGKPSPDKVNALMRYHLFNHLKANGKSSNLLSSWGESPGDAMLFNGLASILEAAKQVNGETSEAQMAMLREELMLEGRDAPSALRSKDSARNILKRPAVDGIGREQTQLAKPVMQEPGAIDRAAKIYVGEWKNMTMPKAGGRTALTLAFSSNRVRNINAAIFHRVPNVNQLIDQQASLAIRDQLYQRAERNRETIKREGDVIKVDTLEGAKFGRIDVSVPLTPQTLQQLRDALPPGEFDQAMEEAKQGVTDLYEYRAEMLEWQADHSELLAELLAPSQPRELASAEQDRLFQSLMRGEMAREQLRNMIVPLFREHLDLLASDQLSAAKIGKVLSKVAKNSLAQNQQAQNAFQLMGQSLFEMEKLLKAREAAAFAKQADTIGEVNPNQFLVSFDDTQASRKLNSLIRSYNAQVQILNAELIGSTRRALGIAGINLARGVKGFTVRSIGKKITGESIKLTDIQKLHGSNRGVTSGNKFGAAVFANMADEVANSLVEAVGATYSENGKSKLGGAKPEINKFLVYLAKEVQRDSEMDLDALIMDGIEAGLNQKGKGLELFTTLLDSLIRSSSESGDLVFSQAKTAAKVEELKLVSAEAQRIQNEIDEINEAIADIEDTNELESMGRTYFRGEVGVNEGDTVINGEGRPVSAAYSVSKMVRNMGVNMSIVPAGLSSNPVEASRAWRDIKPEEGMELTPQELSENARRTGKRRAFHVQREAVIRALTKLSEDHIEDAYKLVRRTGDNFMSFDPLKVINEAVQLAQVEDAVLKERFNQALSDAEVAQMRGMTVEALALLTDPASGEYDTLTINQQKRVNLLRMPKSVEERRERLGRLFTHEGQQIILMPTSAKAQLMQAFPKTITKRNVDSAVAHIALKAIDPTVDPAVKGTNSYFLEFVSGTGEERFDGDNYDLTKGKDLSKNQAAKIFSARFLEKMQGFLDTSRNLSNKGERRTVDLTKDVSSRQVQQYSFMLEKMVLALGDKRIRKETREEIEKLLTAIDSNLEGVDFSQIKIDGRDDVLTPAMKKFRIEPVFSKVFAEIEGDEIMKRLISGMTVHDERTSLFAMKYLHHQDARIRNRFRKTYAARQAARHLVSFLEYGIDGQSGRSGYVTAKKAATEKIAHAAKPLENSAMNQTLGYMIAQLDGMEDNNGMGIQMAYIDWVRTVSKSFAQHRYFVSAQNAHYGKNKFSKYWNAGHIDLVRDEALTLEIEELIKKSKITESAATDDVAVRAAIRDLRALFEGHVSDGKKQQVNDYAKAITEVFTDISNAMHFTMAMESKPAVEIASEAKSRWKHEETDAIKTTYSTVPLRLGYAADPGRSKTQKEGKFVDDPIEIVAFQDSSFFGGLGRNGGQYVDNNVYRPVMVNGLTSPLGMVDDALYRLNVTPTYEVLRRTIGKVESQHGVPTINDGDILSRIMDNAPTKNEFGGNTPEYNRARQAHKVMIGETKTALAGIANEIEDMIQNDSQIGVVNTGGAEVLRFLSSAYIVRSLASIQQMWDQTSGPSVGYITGKLAVGKPRMAANYMKIIGRYLSDKKFRDDVKGFIRVVEPHVFYRTAEGMDVVQDVSRGQVRHGSETFKTRGGQALRKYEEIGEKALGFTIGTGERVLAASIFLTELMDQTGEKDVDSLLLKKAKDFDKMHKVNSLTKVNDMMAQSDQSKKSWLFQSRSESPTMSALWRSLVRFSNHTASMSSNMSVMVPMMFDSESDEQSKLEARENVVTTLVQNILFYPFKIKTLLPFLGYMFYMLAGDDDDEATRKAQKMANDALAIDKDSNPFAHVIKLLMFGKKRELFQSRKNEDAAQASALAELLSRSTLEFATAIPVLGVAAGYSPVSGMIQKAITDNLAESVAATATNLNVAQAWYEKDGVDVRQYQSGWFETAAEFTAPTAAAYDMAAAGKLLLDYNTTRHAERNRAESAMDSAMYLVSELVPFAREMRSQMGGVLKDEVRKEDNRDKKARKGWE